MVNCASELEFVCDIPISIAELKMEKEWCMYVSCINIYIRGVKFSAAPNIVEYIRDFISFSYFLILI
jgi:hypothetical protein